MEQKCLQIVLGMQYWEVMEWNVKLIIMMMILYTQNTNMVV